VLEIIKQSGNFIIKAIFVYFLIANHENQLTVSYSFLQVLNNSGTADIINRKEIVIIGR